MLKTEVPWREGKRLFLIQEFESELYSENRQFEDAQKNLRRSEPQIKKQTSTHEEDKKNHEKMKTMIDNLQQKIKII